MVLRYSWVWLCMESHSSVVGVQRDTDAKTRMRWSENAFKASVI